MTKQQTDEELIQDLTRLASGVYYWRDWHINKHQEEHGENAAFPYDEYVDPAGFLSALVPDGFEAAEKVYKTKQDTLEYWLTKIHASGPSKSDTRFVLREFKSWYSHTASHIRSYRSDVSPDAYVDFLDAFRQDMGFDFLSESGFIRKLTQKILKQGTITSESDMELLDELRADVSQTVLSEDEMAKLSEIMEAYAAPEHVKGDHLEL